MLTGQLPWGELSSPMQVSIPLEMCFLKRGSPHSLLKTLQSFFPC